MTRLKDIRAANSRQARTFHEFNSDPALRTLSHAILETLGGARLGAARFD